MGLGWEVVGSTEGIKWVCIAVEFTRDLMTLMSRQQRQRQMRSANPDVQL